MTIEFTDRYDALGIPAPSLYTMCRGQCEGTGVIPVAPPEAAMGAAEDLELSRRWLLAEEESPSDDGWHFVVCPDCEGSCRTKGLAKRTRQFFWALGKDLAFVRSHLLVRPYTARNAARHRACADRTDVPFPWLWNRRVALRVLLRRV